MINPSVLLEKAKFDVCHLERAFHEEEDSSDAEYEGDSADGEGEVFDVDYETVITLPDGREMTIEELSNGCYRCDIWRH